MEEAAKATERALLKFIYKDDRLIEENIAGAIRNYSYNEKGQLIQSVESKPKKETSVYSYNEQGLITEINSTSIFDGGQMGSKTIKYSYEYY